MKEIKIKKEFSNQRVDKFVRKYLNDAPLSFIYKLFRKKDVKINDHWVKPEYILKCDDNLKIYVTDEQLNDFIKPLEYSKINFDIDIIYEDENILIVNKPSGILVHGHINEKRITLSNKVLGYLVNKNEYNPNDRGFVPSPCHRLDRNTSGLVIFAKNIISSQILMEEFKTHNNLSKVYIGLVKGKVNNKGKIDAPLYKDENTGKVTIKSIKDGGKNALTYYEPICFNELYSLLKINIVTGRTHQIRVHLSYIDHPLIGDSKYGDFNINKIFEKDFNYKNQFLHAYSISFNKLPNELSYLSNKTFKAKLPLNKEKIIYQIYNNFDINNI